MTPGDRLAAAKRDAGLARDRLTSTATALQQRLQPSTIANNAWDGVKEKSEELADGAVRAVRERPAMASGVAAGLALFFAREPILSAISSRSKRSRAANEQNADPFVGMETGI